MPLPLVLLGAGGHASDVLGVVEAVNDRQPTYAVVGVLDDDPDADATRFHGRGVTVLGSVDLLAGLDAAWVASVGWPASRRRLVEQAQVSSQPAATLVSPLADVGHGVVLGAGAVVMGSARLSPRCCIGKHVLVSYLAAVGHDSTVGDGTSVMPGAMISGGVEVGTNVLIGTNATVLEGLRIGNDATVSAGAVVLTDVQAGTTVIGVPARPVVR